MKRTILSIAFVAVATLMLTAVANNNDANENLTQDKCKKECCDNNKIKRGKHHKARMFNPFEGITLSDSQKEQLKAKALERKANREEMMKAHSDENKKMRKQWSDMRKQYLEDLKLILTPEQYVQYLENLALNSHNQKPKFHKHRTPRN